MLARINEMLQDESIPAEQVALDLLRMAVDIRLETQGGKSAVINAAAVPGRVLVADVVDAYEPRLRIYELDALCELQFGLLHCSSEFAEELEGLEGDERATRIFDLFCEYLFSAEEEDIEDCHADRD